MGKYTDFGLIEFETGEYSRDIVPEHTQESIENYLIHGWMPGGFMEAMLAGDIFRAAACGDQVNGPAMQGIANWIAYGAPHGSWGSYEKVKDWAQNKDDIRTKYSDGIEKAYIIKILKT